MMINDFREQVMLDELALVNAREVTVVIPASGKASEAKALADGVMLKTVVDVFTRARIEFRVRGDLHQVGDGVPDSTPPGGSYHGVTVTIILAGALRVPWPAREGDAQCIGCGVHVLTDERELYAHLHLLHCPFKIIFVDEWSDLGWSSWLLGHGAALRGLPLDEEAVPVYRLGWERGRFAYLAKQWVERERQAAARELCERGDGRKATMGTLCAECDCDDHGDRAQLEAIKAERRRREEKLSCCGHSRADHSEGNDRCAFIDPEQGGRCSCEGAALR